MMCMRSDGMGSPLSIMVNILFMVSTLDFSEVSIDSHDRYCSGTRSVMVHRSSRSGGRTSSVPFSRCVFNLLTNLQSAWFLGKGKVKNGSSMKGHQADHVDICISRQVFGHRLWNHDLEGTYSCNVGWSAVLSWCTILYASSEYDAIARKSFGNLQPAGLVV